MTKSYMKALLVGFVVFAGVAALAIASPLISIKKNDDFGFTYAEQQGFASQQALVVTAVGRSQVYSYAVASRVGGVILQGVASATDGHGASVPTLLYDPAKPDGRRFRMKIGGNEATVSAPDWAVVPLIRFVDTPETAAMSLLGEPITAAERRARYQDGTMFIETHQRLHNTVIGNNFIFTDAMLVKANPNKMRTVTEHLSEELPGYSDLGVFDESKSIAAAGRISSLLHSVQGNWNTYIFSDVDVSYKYSIKDQQLNVEGEPYYAFLRVRRMDESVTVDDHTTDLLRGDPALLYDLNPKIYALDRKLFQLAAIFRDIKNRNNAGWGKIVEQVKKARAEPRMPTPRGWTP